jgi:hypothetical protein
MRSSGQNDVPILRGQVRRQQGDPAEMKLAFRQHDKEHRVLARSAGRNNAQIRLGLGEVKHPGRVREHRRARLVSVELPLVHLGHVRDEIGFGAARGARELDEAFEQLLVGDRLEWALLFHAWNIGRGFSTLCATASEEQIP